MDTLVGTKEIAERLGVGHVETVNAWRRRHEDFPTPLVQVGGVNIWAWPDVEKWAKATGRLP